METEQNASELNRQWIKNQRLLWRSLAWVSIIWFGLGFISALLNLARGNVFSYGESIGILLVQGIVLFIFGRYLFKTR